MVNVLQQKLKIIPKPDYITWIEITDLLHAAFSERKEKGLDYLATNQSVETTISRVGDGICLVALLDDNLVGTATLQIRDVQKNNKKWFYENKYGYLKQLAVHPDYKRKGIGQLLYDERIRLCYEFNVDAVFFDTSTKAKSMHKWHKRMGAQKVEFISHPMTNYYSIRFRTRINGKKFNRIYASIRYNISMLKCILTKDKNGNLRALGKLLKAILDKK
jgi:GNAT superfamily N-acetyltransferase